MPVAYPVLAVFVLQEVLVLRNQLRIAGAATTRAGTPCVPAEPDTITNLEFLALRLLVLMKQPVSSPGQHINMCCYPIELDGREPHLAPSSSQPQAFAQCCRIWPWFLTTAYEPTDT